MDAEPEDKYAEEVADEEESERTRGISSVMTGSKGKEGTLRRTGLVDASGEKGTT
jgi:hypothetical protein